MPSDRRQGLAGPASAPARGRFSAPWACRRRTALPPALRHPPELRAEGLTGVPSRCALRYSPLGRPGVLSWQHDIGVVRGATHALGGSAAQRPCEVADWRSQGDGDEPSGGRVRPGFSPRICPRIDSAGVVGRDSNCDQGEHPCVPGETTRNLSPAIKSTAMPCWFDRYFLGVADGARTHDNRNHNPGLYQLSYSHLRNRKV